MLTKKSIRRRANARKNYSERNQILVSFWKCKRIKLFRRKLNQTDPKELKGVRTKSSKLSFLMKMTKKIILKNLNLKASLNAQISPNLEATPEPKPQKQVGATAEAKLQTKAKAETKVEAKAEAKVEAILQAEAKVEAILQAEAEAKVEAILQAKVMKILVVSETKRKNKKTNQSRGKPDRIHIKTIRKRKKPPPQQQRQNTRSKSKMMITDAKVSPPA